MVKVIKNEILNDLNCSLFDKISTIQIMNSVINKLELPATRLEYKVVIENCIIDTLFIHSCWFDKGLIFKRNIVKNEIDYQMGGHNNDPIIIENNIFQGFFNFFDCHFKDSVEVSGNIFINGSNFLGNQDTGFRNLFNNNYTVKENIGRIDLDM